MNEVNYAVKMGRPAYAAPRLVAFGDVTTLTAANSGISCESGQPRNNAGECKGSPTTGGNVSGKQVRQ
jgi:hypothetical protein